MHGRTWLNRLSFLIVVPLLIGCGGPVPAGRTEQVVRTTDLQSYRVEDSSGALTLKVVDVLISPDTGNIEYIVVEAPLSAFGQDFKSAASPFQRIMIIPWRLLSVDMENERLVLKVDDNALVHGPRFGPLPRALAGNWREVVESYWPAQPEGN